MPSHLRNGKDLSFEQQRAAERAAKRAQQLYQQAAEPPSTAGLPRVDEQPSSVEHQQTVKHPSTVRSSPPSAYTLSPAALERLRQSQEQQSLVDGADQYRLVGNGSNLPARDLQRAELQPAQLGVDEFEVAARDQQHAEKQGIVGFPDAKEYQQYNSVNHPCSFEQDRAGDHTSAAEFCSAAEFPITIGYCAEEQPDPASHRSTAGGYPPVGYTLGPAAIERLCRASEQQSNILAAQLRSPQDKAKLPMNSPFGGFLPGKYSSAGFQPVKASPPSSGETANYQHKLRRPNSLNSQLYDADTNKPLSPHELSSQRSRTVHQSLAPQSNLFPANTQTNKGNTSHYSQADASACLSGLYVSPRSSDAANANTVTPIASTASAIVAETGSEVDVSFSSPLANSTRYWTPAKHTPNNLTPALNHSEAHSLPLNPPSCSVPTRWTPGQPTLPEEQEDKIQSHNLHDAGREFPDAHGQSNSAPITPQVLQS
ncbi:hypothetical protein PCANC_26026 [Puccinia coronata f. sp. avenae]|uniref:Uncharacterized protein n=1 Tax=Puccinia coronata f. sp. avenae TaxID=200324 RepID=A0A2N5S6E2_9BASI|nr:hypothetical protein PCANC_26026 [Puccinia coronata f. sp. avenae]